MGFNSAFKGLININVDFLGTSQTSPDCPVVKQYLKGNDEYG